MRKCLYVILSDIQNRYFSGTTQRQWLPIRDGQLHIKNFPLLSARNWLQYSSQMQLDSEFEIV